MKWIHYPLFYCLSLACVGGALANTQPNPPVCFTNRFGVEQCGYGENAPTTPPPQNNPRSLSSRTTAKEGPGTGRYDNVRQAVADYCARQQAAGLNQSDGLCATANAPR